MALYLNLGSGIPGAVTAQGFERWIEIDSYSWGFSVAIQTTVGNAGNRLSSGRITPSDMHMTKQQDDSTSMFMKAALSGKALQTATLVVTVPTDSSAATAGSGMGTALTLSMGAGGAIAQGKGDGADRYMEYTLTNVLCSSFQTSGSGHGGQPSESISLNFSKIDFAQYLKAADGSTRDAVRGAYDFTTNVAA